MGLRGPKSFNERIAIARNRLASPAVVATSADDRRAPPRHLSAETKAWWRGIVHRVEPHQLRTLQVAAEALDRGSAARKVIAEQDMSYADNKGRRHARPEIKIERDAWAIFLRAMRDLRLDAPPPRKAAPVYNEFGNPIRQ